MEFKRKLSHPNCIRLVDISWFPEIYLSSRRNPPLDDVKVAIRSSIKDWGVSIVVALGEFDPGILQHLTNTGGVSYETGEKKGSLSIFLLHIDIYVRMCQEEWNHGGKMAAVLASQVQ